MTTGKLKTKPLLIQRDTVTYTGEKRSRVNTESNPTLIQGESNQRLIQRESFYTHRVEEVVVYHKLMYFSSYYLGKGAMAA